jgi:hypothetical protein
MNVELTIQKMFDSYPGLFKERADCLDQLFCTNGCGYEWENGELVDCQYNQEEMFALEKRLVNGKAHQYNKLSLRAESIMYGLERKKKQGIIIPENPMDVFDEYERQYFDSLSDDEYYTKPRRKRWYFYIDIPGHEHIDMHERFVHLFNYPDDIKPDWLAAIEETKMLLKEDGYNV